MLNPQKTSLLLMALWCILEIAAALAKGRARDEAAPTGILILVRECPSSLEGTVRRLRLECGLRGCIYPPIWVLPTGQKNQLEPLLKLMQKDGLVDCSPFDDSAGRVVHL